MACQVKFLSTLSLRRATAPRVASLFGRCYFYPRSPCGERRVTVLGIQHKVGISIHALLAESDYTHPITITVCVVISIHALLAESDCTTTITICIALRFLSTLSLRRATTRSRYYSMGRHISIHALLAESDSFSAGTKYDRAEFLSTLSLRRATQCRL